MQNFKIIEDQYHIMLCIKCLNIKFLYFKIMHTNIYGSCKYSEDKGPRPLRTVVPCPSNQAQTIEFL